MLHRGGIELTISYSLRGNYGLKSVEDDIVVGLHFKK